MLKRALTLTFILLAAATGPARAIDAVAPYDGDLQRLSEILGALHYLRGICGSNEGAEMAQRNAGADRRRSAERRAAQHG